MVGRVLGAVVPLCACMCLQQRQHASSCEEPCLCVISAPSLRTCMCIVRLIITGGIIPTPNAILAHALGGGCIAVAAACVAAACHVAPGAAIGSSRQGRGRGRLRRGRRVLVACTWCLLAPGRGMVHRLCCRCGRCWRFGRVRIGAAWLVLCDPAQLQLVGSMVDALGCLSVGVGAWLAQLLVSACAPCIKQVLVRKPQLLLVHSAWSVVFECLRLELPYSCTSRLVQFAQWHMSRATTRLHAHAIRC